MVSDTMSGLGATVLLSLLPHPGAIIVINAIQINETYVFFMAHLLGLE
jgi:hypothetical protein